MQIRHTKVELGNVDQSWTKLVTLEFKKCVLVCKVGDFSMNKSFFVNDRNLFLTWTKITVKSMICQ